MSILDEMRNEQQETEPSSTASNLSEPTNADVIAAVNRQTKAVNGLKSYLRIAIEETVKEELKGLPSTLQPSVNKSPQIESTFREFAQSLDGKQLQSASQSLIAEAQMNRAATASATEKLQSLAEDNQKLVSQVGGAVQRIEKRTEERVEKAVEQVTGEASATMTANIDASNERAERIIAATATLGPVSSGRSPRRCASPSCRWSWSSPGSGWASPGSLRALSGRWTGTGTCGSGSGAGSWSALASPGPVTPSSRPCVGSPAWWRRGRAAGCRRGRAGARGDRDSRGQARGARAAAPASGRLVSVHCIVQCMLTIASRLDVMSRLGRAMADPTRSKILMSLLDGPSHPAVLSRELGLTRSNVSNHLTCLRDCGIVVAEPEGRQTRYEIADPHLAGALTALVDVTLAVDESAPCIDPHCSVPGCCAATGSGDAS